MRRRSDVQRWPAVPMAEKAMPRRARSRSALGQTMAALLPPSSRMARANRCARLRRYGRGPSRLSRWRRREGPRGLSTSSLAECYVADEEGAEAGWYLAEASGCPGEQGVGCEGGEGSLLGRLPDD